MTKGWYLQHFLAITGYKGILKRGKAKDERKSYFPKSKAECLVVLCGALLIMWSPYRSCHIWSSMGAAMFANCMGKGYENWALRPKRGGKGGPAMDRQPDNQHRRVTRQQQGATIKSTDTQRKLRLRKNGFLSCINPKAIPQMENSKQVSAFDDEFLRTFESECNATKRVPARCGKRYSTWEIKSISKLQGLQTYS